MNITISITLIFISIACIIVMGQMQKKGRLVEKGTYSYLKFIKYYAYGLLILSFLCFILLLSNLPFEFVLSIGTFLFFCLTAALLNNLFGQYQAMKKGYKKKNSK